MRKKELDLILDRIYEGIDLFFQCEQFVAVDLIIRDIAMKETDVDLILGYLIATFPAKSKLKKRAKLYKRTKKLLKKQYPDSWKDLLKGLE